MDRTPPARTDRRVETAPSGLRIGHDVAERRFLAERAGRLIGFLEYALLGRKMLLTHTEVTPDERGRGVSDELVLAAIAHIRANALVMRPLCGFVAGWIRKHPEYAELVDPVDRERITASSNTRIDHSR